ncbi:hypothetical protein [Acetobacterium wieringae]|uniref:Uncharacterized protein n=1 Tax=Acetobacterium wieringae TaxID=52694 RepID=A0A1F2PFN3_9FIRM|nr:hypothetical protein [Acetobacterium wieringae]OFV70157.1 hypothetical protein ACWI_23620 [Acetobacterium wieringae]
MSIRIIEKLKNQQGSSLAFVLIIGMIIMIMVASLLAVANSDFTFTQETVESRQAYIDAKSVIEYGKIEINERMKWLEIENTNLKNLYLELERADARSVASIQAQINNKIAEIEAYMKAPYYIGGDEKNIAGTLKEITGESDAVGILNVTPEVVSAQTASSNKELKYIFKITTHKLRRKLDYEVSMNYQAASVSEMTGSIPTIPGDASADWLDTKIDLEKNNKCIIQKNGVDQTGKFDCNYVNNALTVSAPGLSLDVGRDKKNPNDKSVKFNWIQENTLNLTAKDICFTAPFQTVDKNVWKAIFNVKATNELRFKKDYVQNNMENCTNTFEAENMIFEGDLVIKDNSHLIIKCKNLWINGDIKINDPSGTQSSLTIEAENIIVGNYNNNTGGNIILRDKSIINWDCTGSILIRGNVNLLTNVAQDGGKDYGNTFKAKNISIGSEENKSTVTLQNNTKVTWDCENFWLHGNLTAINSRPIIEFKNIKYLKAGDLKLADQTELSVIGATGANANQNQMIVGRIEPIPVAVGENNKHNLSFLNLYSLTCDSLILNDNSQLQIQSNIIKIIGTNGNQVGINASVEKQPAELKADANASNFALDFIKSAEITTEYFDVSGKTYLERTIGNLEIKPISGKLLNVRFANGYRQVLSKVKINNADLLVFGGVVNITGDNIDSLCQIEANAKRIYFDSDLIKFQEQNDGNVRYFAVGDIKTRVSVKTAIQKWGWSKVDNQDVFVNKGSLLSANNYIATVSSDIIPNNLSVEAISPPAWVTLNVSLPTPSEPKGVGGAGGSGGGTTGDVTNGKITTGTEKYY